MIFSNLTKNIFDGIKNIGIKFNTVDSIFGNGFTSQLNTDIAKIQEVKALVNSGIAKPDINFGQVMAGASQGAIDFAKNTDISTESMKRFVDAQREMAVAATASNKSLGNVGNILKTWNNGVGNLGMTQQQFVSAVSQGNTALGNYLSGLNGAKASMSGYIGSLVAAKAATIGLQAASMALNMALTMGVSLIVTGVFKLISGAIENASKTSTQRIKELREEYDQLRSDVEKAASSYKNTKETVEDIAPRLSELAKGVDEYGHNISLTDEEYAEFIKYNNQIAEMFPELNMGFDSNGNAMLAMSYNADTLTDSLNELLEAQRQVANDDIAKKLPEAFSNVKSTVSEYESQVDALEKTKDQVTGVYKQIKEILENGGEISFNVTGGTQSYGNEANEAEALKGQLDSLGLKYHVETYHPQTSTGQDTTKTYERVVFDFDPEDLERIYGNQMAGVAKKIEDYNEKMSESWKAINPFLQAWLDSDYTYNMLSDEMKSVATRLVGNLDFSKIDADTAEDLQNYIKTNILNVLNGATPEVQKKFAELMSLDPKSTNVGEYWAKMEKGIEELAPQVDLSKDQLEQIFGFDDYKKTVVDFKKNLKEATGAADDDITDFVDKLNGDDVNRAIKISAMFDYDSLDEFQALLDSGIFTAKINIEVEKGALEQLFDKSKGIVPEAVGAYGLSDASMEFLSSRYADLEGFDPTTLFRRTANGIRLNVEAVADLEKEYANFKLDAKKAELERLEEEWRKVNDEIANYTGDEAGLQELKGRRDNLEAEITQVGNLVSQYGALASAYNRWLMLKDAGSDKDSYVAVGEGFDDMKQVIESGWTDNPALKAYLDILVGGAGDATEKWAILNSTIENTGHTLMDYWTTDANGNYTSNGLYTFLQDVHDLMGEDYAFQNADGTWSFDFSDEKLQAVADRFHTTTEMVEMFIRALDEAGNTVNLGKVFDFEVLDDIEGTVDEINTALASIGADPITIDLDADLDGVTQQIEDLKAAKAQLFDDEGNLRVGVDPNTVLKFNSIIASMVAKRQALTAPAIMSVDTSGLNEEMTNAIELVQQFQNLANEREILIEIGADTTDVDAQMNSVLSQITELDPEILAGLNISTDNLSDVETFLSSIGGVELTAEAKVNYSANMDGVNGEDAPDKDGKVTYTPNFSACRTAKVPSRTGTVTYTAKWPTGNAPTKTGYITYTEKPNGNKGPRVNGSASIFSAMAHGTAYARGNWGVKDSGVALGGEVGQELVVRDGRFFTIGDNGTEFFRYKKNDIIFNAGQTREIFKYGKIINGKKRGEVFANGSAYAEGNAFVYNANGGGGSAPSGSYTSLANNSGSSGKSGSGSSNKSGSSDKDNEKVFDWIEVAIKRLERVIENLDRTAKSIYKKWSVRNDALRNEIDIVVREIDVQQRGYDRYIQEANSVGLDEYWASLVRYGAIDISTITDEDLAEKIQKYQEWIDKAFACEDAIEELKEKEKDLHKQIFENIGTQYDKMIEVYDFQRSMIEEFINQSEASGYVVSENYYKALIAKEQENLQSLKDERRDLLDEFASQIASGTIVAGTEAYYDMAKAVNDVTLAIEESNTKIIEWNKNIQDIHWEYFDLMQKRISNITAEADFLIDLMENKKLFDDHGQATGEGNASLGLHAVNYDVYMEQADRYAEEMKRINAELARDPNNKNLYDRRHELVDLQRQAILNAEGEKNAIKDLVEEGIKLELDSLKELIDQYGEALDSQKELYDYQKRVKDQTAEVASLQKQLAAYAGDTSEENKARIQKITVSLEEAQENLRETEYDKYVSDQKKLLDDLYNEYEEILNKRLDDIDGLMREMIAYTNENKSEIISAIMGAADNVGYALSGTLNNIFGFGANNGNMVGFYGTGSNNTTNTVEIIENKVNSMEQSLNSIADTNLQMAKGGSKRTATDDPEGLNYAIFMDEMDEFGALLDAIMSGLLKHYGFPSKEEVQDLIDEGYKPVWGGYASGVRRIRHSSLAWTQENGREFIIRPSDGAILTPLAKNDSVLNAAATDNIWNMANNPEQFIRDNLDLGIGRSPVTISGGDSYGDIAFSITLPNVTNYEQFRAALVKDKSFEQLVRSVSTDKLFGGSKLKKYRV